MLCSVAHAISATLYSRPGYDLINDFAAVTLLASGSFALVSHPSLPAKSVQELIALASKRPGQVNVATAGAALRLAAKLFDSTAGIKTTEINYKSTPQAVTALISGEASLGFAVTSAVMPNAKVGKLRVLAVTSARRSPLAPEVPTVAESGVPGYDVTAWYGLLVPARTAKEIVERLHAAAASAIADAGVRKRFATTDFEPVVSTPEQLGAHVGREVAKWAKVIKDSAMTAD